jgi:hypothetical protein
MKKLRLDLDNLQVDSFGTGAVSGSGTVNGHVADAFGTTVVIATHEPDIIRVSDRKIEISDGEVLS